MERRAFHGMGTEIELLLDVPPSTESAQALATARAEFVRLEALLSRFREDSELSALNRSGSLHAGPDLLAITQLALDARRRTAGRFDPTVHDALVAAGYDRSFELLADGVATLAPPARCSGRVTVDVASGLIEIEPGYRLDLGGIAKGYAVDRACDLLEGAGPCLVDAGGDMAVRGRPWPVGVDTGKGRLTLEISNGAIATSGVDRRRWHVEDGEAHHLIDPLSGRPAETDLQRVTVVAATAAEAEVLAKSLFLSGAAQGAREADALAIPAVLVTTQGETVLAGGLA
jgi:thiamine biosynthesis lipoprotein